MSKSPTAVAEMDRDELEDEVLEHRRRIRDLEQAVADLEAEKADLSRVQHAEARLERSVSGIKRRFNDLYDEVVTRDVVNQLVRQLVGEDAVESVTDHPLVNVPKVAAVRDRLDDLESAVRRHDSVIEEQATPDGDTKEQAWQNVIEYAENVRDEPDHELPDEWVGLYRDDIKAATGYTKERGRQLIDEWAEEKEGTEKRPYKRLTTSRKTESANIQRKMLKVDLSVWGDADA